jgi:hypothetical protein
MAGTAVQLAGLNGRGKVALWDVGEAVLCSAEGVLPIVIFGETRLGKSFVASYLQQREGSFTSGNGFSCTKGVYIGADPLRLAEFAALWGCGDSAQHRGDARVAILDLEGQGSRGASYDYRLLAPLAMACPALLFVVKSFTQTHTILDKMSVLNLLGERLVESSVGPADKIFGHGKAAVRSLCKL